MGGKDKVEMSTYLDILEDPSGQLTFSEILSNQDLPFKPFVNTAGADKSLGFTKSIFWAKLTIDADDQVSSNYLFELSFPQSSYIDYYRNFSSNDLGWDRTSTGLLMPAATRHYKNTGFVFDLSSNKKSIQTYYFRFKAIDDLRIPLTLWGKQAFFAQERTKLFLFGMYFGVYIIMTIFNFFLFLVLRDRTFLVYVLFISTFGLWMFSLRGYVNYFFPSLFDRFPLLNFNMNVGLAFSNYFAAEFSSLFLGTEKYSKLLREIKRTIGSVAVLSLGIVIWFDYRDSVNLEIFLITLTTMIILGEAIWQVVKKNRVARYFLIAWSMLLGGGLVYVGMLYGVFPVNFWTEYSVNLGSILEIILLSFALANRFNLIAQQKLKIQKDLHSLQTKYVLEIQDQLKIDTLTGLRNRNSLLSDLSKVGDFHLLLININRFREINYFFWHAAGDFVISELGKRLNLFCFENQFSLYRLRGDEFAVVLPSQFHKTMLTTKLEMIQTFCESQTFQIGEKEIQVQVTLGLAVGKENAFQKADEALRLAKQKHQKYFFISELDQTQPHFENLIWVRTIREAISSERVLAFYQPILNLKTKRLEKFETLIRLKDSTGKILSPGQFLPIAKRAKLYGSLSREMILQAFNIIESDDREFSVNLSVDDILEDATLDLLLACLSQSKNSHRIVFELLESESIESYDSVRNFIASAKASGAKFAIDDFGSGYSNFDHLIKLNVDYIKIDGSLIKKIDVDYQSEILVENIVDFSNKLGISTIAEFVHSDAVLKKIMALGVHYAQGYFIGEPAPQPKIIL